MEQATVLRRRQPGILSLTWPIFIELLLQMLVGNADQVMVGHFDPNGVGAIGNANQITNLVLLVFSVISTASTILISRYLGAEDKRRVNETYTLSLLVNAIFGLAVGAILIALCGPIFTLMQVPAEILERSCLYLRIICGGMVFQAVYLTFTAFFRSNQMMKESMIVAVVMNLLNIGGNAVLIGGAFGLPALGVAGAALSSDISRVVGVILIAVLFRRKFGSVLSLKLLRPSPPTSCGGCCASASPPAESPSPITCPRWPSSPSATCLPSSLSTPGYTPICSPCSPICLARPSPRPPRSWWHT